MEREFSWLMCAANILFDMSSERKSNKQVVEEEGGK
jgi:hypothetical protein